MAKPPCAFPDYPFPIKTRGHCSGHYQQLLAGKQLKRILKTLPAVDRFWARVDKAGKCWEWRGGRNNTGYGTFRAGGGATVTVHRFAYELLVGPIPEGHVVDHMCFNKGCVNPAHLNACTQKQNLENRPGPYANSKTGVRGVHPATRRPGWFAGQVKHDGRIHFVGYFPTIEEAEAAVIAKRNELFTNNLLDRKSA